MTSVTFCMAAVPYFGQPSVMEKPITKAGPRNAGVPVAELTDEEIAELRKIYESCDLNGDGFIDQEEFHSLLQELDGDVSRAECLLDFEVADTEGDGYIGFKEFIVWWTS
jgi:Ca2+-binding EF-hand superfamily protein